MKALPLLLPVILFLLVSCSDERQRASRGPIVLGDSSTIVTETDPKYLQDFVPDLHQAISGDDSDDDAASTDTVAKPAKPFTAQPAAPVGNGLTIAFKEVTIFLPGITTSTKLKDLTRSRSASYTMTGGTLNGNKLQVSGGATIQKVSQRYQTVLTLKDDNEMLPLESLGTYASPWQPLSGNGSHAISGLDQPKFSDARPAAIRNAVQQAARKKRMSRKDMQSWIDVAEEVKSTSQLPCVPQLRSVIWQVEGKDAQGKKFMKELRIDVPAA